MGLRCPNVQCAGSASNGTASIIRHGFCKTKWGKRRRYRCRSCRKTFCSNSETLYHRLQHCRGTFDEVAALSVEGLNKSAISRIKGIAWNTVAHWLEKASESCRRFNDRRTVGFCIAELQADEIRSIIHDKERPIWIFAAIEVWSRQPGSARYTTARQAERYVRRKEAVIN